MDLETFRNDARTWLADNAERAPRDYGAIMPPEMRDAGVAWQQHLFAEGWAGIHWPTEYGGRGLTPDHQSIWVEECANAEVPAFINMVGFVLAGQGIQRFGTDEQKERHLRPIITAERVWCQLFSEPEAGSDLASLRTTAVADGDTFVVNGQKVWCSGGRISDWGILMARTNPDVAKHKGISFFLLDMSLPGIDVRPLRQMTGGSEFDEVFLTDVVIPADSLLGPINEGWGVGMATLTNERGSIGAAQIAMQRRLDAMVALGAQAEQQLGAVERDRLTRLVARGQSLLAMGKRQGPAASVGSSLGKLGTTEMAFDNAVLKAELRGPEGMLWNADTKGLTAAPGGRIAGGSSQIQRSIIGERILGLPKEPSANPPATTNDSKAADR
ncbi:MAG: acyl-CoA dehydrogenase family protein [Acidimicrobiales bacterium]